MLIMIPNLPGTCFISLKFAKSVNQPSMICRIRMAPDPYADIDFDEINEATSLAHDEIKCLKVNYVKQTYLLMRYNLYCN